MFRTSIIQDVTVVDYSIVGTKQDPKNPKGVPIRSSDAPVMEDCIIVDPGSERNFQGHGFFHGHNPVFNKPRNASKALYDVIGITRDGFGPNTRKIVTQECKAAFDDYGKDGKHVPVIHVASPDFGQWFAARLVSPWKEAEVLRKLTTAWRNVFHQLTIIPKDVPQRIVMLPVLAGAINAGVFQKEMPRLTFAAMDAAAQEVGVELLQRLGMEFRLCTFTAKEHNAFVAAQDSFLIINTPDIDGNLAFLRGRRIDLSSFAFLDRDTFLRTGKVVL